MLMYVLYQLYQLMGYIEEYVVTGITGRENKLPDETYLDLELIDIAKKMI